MDRLAFEPNGVIKHGLVYTTLSHVKDIKSPYLLSELQQSNFSVFGKFVLEMERLINKSHYRLEYSLDSMPRKKCFLICSLNTWSLSLHIEHIAHDNEIMNVHAIRLQETHKYSHQKATALTANYANISMFHLHGISTYYKKTVVLHRSFNYTTKYIDAIIANFQIKTTMFRITNAYIAPRASVNDIIQFVISIMQNLQENHPIVFVGDFKIWHVAKWRCT